MARVKFIGIRETLTSVLPRTHPEAPRPNRDAFDVLAAPTRGTAPSATELKPSWTQGGAAGGKWRSMSIAV